MTVTSDTLSPHWLKKLHWFVFGGSVSAATVAILFEGKDSLIGCLFILLCTSVVCCWTVLRTPSVEVSACIVIAAIVVLGWTVAEPEATLFQLVIIAAVVGWQVKRFRLSLLLFLLMVIAPPFGNAGTTEDTDWGWWNWCMGVVIAWCLGRVIQCLEIALGELSSAQAQLIDIAAKEERLRISRDVHDLVGHSLTALLLNVRAAIRTLHTDPSATQRALIDAEKIGTAGINDVRTMWTSLRTDSTTNIGGESLASLPDGEAVQQLLARQDNISVHTTGDIAGLNGPVAIATFRVLQECITNILRHGALKNASIELKVKPDEVRLISVNSVAPPDSSHVHLADKAIGLVGMRERVASLGGDFSAGVDGEFWRLDCRIPRYG